MGGCWRRCDQATLICSAIVAFNLFVGRRFLAGQVQAAARLAQPLGQVGAWGEVGVAVPRDGRRRREVKVVVTPQQPVTWFYENSSMKRIVHERGG